MAVLATNTRSHAHAGESALGHWGRGVSKRFEEWLSYRRTVKALTALTDRELADIGLTRSDIKFVARNGRR